MVLNGINTIYGCQKAVQDGRLDIGPGAHAVDSHDFTEELNALCRKDKEQEKEIWRIREENEFCMRTVGMMGVNAWDLSGHKIKSSSSGKKWTKNNELSPSYAKQKGYAKVKKGKITKIKFHYNGKDRNINFGYGHVIALGEKDIHKDDKKIWKKYLKGKDAHWWNINKKNIWVSVKECNRRFNKDIKFIVNKINTDLPNLKVNQNQADALIDFRYNI